MEFFENVLKLASFGIEIMQKFYFETKMISISERREKMIGL